MNASNMNRGRHQNKMPSVRFRAAVHRVLNDQTMLDPTLFDKDDSKPLYSRPQCMIGIYCDVYDAKPNKTREVSLQHAFMMSVADKMYEHLKSLDLTELKGALLAKNCGEGVVLRAFKIGCVLEVLLDSVQALDDLWSLHKKGRLTPIFQEVLVLKPLLDATHASKVVLRARLWEDEYMACRAELSLRPTDRVKLTSCELDLQMVQRVKENQHDVPKLISEARDHEDRFEVKLGEFMLTVKRALPAKIVVMKNMKEFITNMRVAKGLKPAGFESVDNYLKAIEFFKQAFAHIGKKVVNPLCQVQALCENDKQRKTKKVIRDAWSEITALLKPDADLTKIRYNDWESKVLKREEDLFLGLISVVPLCLDRLTTIDVSTDEYIMDFPEINE